MHHHLHSREGNKKGLIFKVKDQKYSLVHTSLRTARSAVSSLLRNKRVTAQSDPKTEISAFDC